MTAPGMMTVKYTFDAVLLPLMRRPWSMEKARSGTVSRESPGRISRPFSTTKT